MNTLPVKNESSSATLLDVLATDDLTRRECRPANYRVEAQVMAILAQTLADRPEDILQVLVRTAVELCGGGTCGISLLESDGRTKVFRWVALAGVCEKYAGGCTPRDHSPCGVTLDRGVPQLFIAPGRYFTYLADLEQPITEGLVIPFFHGDLAFGTIWIAAHDPNRQFDREDARLMSRLGAFTSAGLQTVRSLTSADKARQGLAFLAALRRRLSIARDSEEMTKTGMALIGEYFLADRCSLLQLGDTNEQFVVQYDWRGTPSHDFSGGHRQDSVAGASFWRTAANGSFAVGDVRNDPNTGLNEETFRRWEILSLASTPRGSRQASTQLLWLATRRPREWTSDELCLLESAAAHIFACWPAN